MNPTRATAARPRPVLRFISAAAALLVVAGGACAQAAAVTAADRTFARTIAAGVRSQPDYGAQQASVQQARGGVTSARADFLPRVQLLVDSGEDRSVRAGVDDLPGSRRSGEINPQLALSQLLYDGGAAFGRYRAAKNRMESATQGVDAVANNLALRGVQVYFTVLRQREAVRIADENLAKVTGVRDKVVARAAEGRDPLSEQSRLDSRVLEARSQLEDAQRNLEDAEAAYEEFFGSRPGELVVPDTWPAHPAGVDHAISLARESNPELQSLRSELDASSAEQRAERAALLWPRLSLEFTGTAPDALGSDGLKNRDTYVGLRFSYDLFNGGATLGRSVQAAGRRRAAQYAVERADRALERGLRQAYAAVAARERQSAAMAERMQRDRQAIDDYEELFLAGRRSLNDLIVAQRDYFSSATQLLDVELDLRVQRFSVVALTGGLPGWFGLDADPANGTGSELQ
jgi:adhesin transport system outer membrane protein